MATRYNPNSPWYSTPIKDGYLDVLSIRPVSRSSSDRKFIITQQYAYRPDLLAYDLYGNQGLWWVFIQRNLDVLYDPIFDFAPGVTIYVPDETQLKQVLGTK